MDPKRLKGFTHIIIPMWDLLPRVIGIPAYEVLSKDSRVVGIPLRESPLTRTEFRAYLRKGGISATLDFDSDKIIAGRYANVIYNWDDKPVSVKIPEQKAPIQLTPYQYMILP